MTGPPLSSRAGDAPTRRVLSLASDPAGVRAARHGLRTLLAETGEERWLEQAELACTELVTNAVLHAHTDITLTFEVRPDELLVEVSDGNPDLPVQRSRDHQATTGRGMTLVAALTSDHGVRDVGPHGKTVWFSLRADAAEPSEEQLLAAWDVDSWDLTGVSADGGTDEDTGSQVAADEPAAVAVTLPQLPPTLWLAAAEHHDTMLRELVLYVAEHDEVVVDMATTDAARTLLSAAVWAAVESAQRAGTARPALSVGHPGRLPEVPDLLELELEVPRDGVAGFAAMQDALDVAERLAAEGKLLARPGLPEIVAVRDWACEQVLAQHAGAPPAPWPGTDHERFTAVVAAAPDGRAVDWDVTAVQAESRAVVAADDTNRIVAVSRAMAELVGWDVADLVGRRIVTLVPHRLREAHVAGFSRHLTTGEAHLLGRTLELPVLHADGTELLYRVRIDEGASVAGRRLYLAWFDGPIGDGDPRGASA